MQGHKRSCGGRTNRWVDKLVEEGLVELPPQPALIDAELPEEADSNPARPELTRVL